MDYRGVPISGGGWLEILLLTVPVAGYLVYRRLAKREQFGFRYVMESSFVAYLNIGVLIFIGVFLLIPAYYITLAAAFLYAFLTDKLFENVKTFVEFRYLLAVIWIFFAYKAYDYFHSNRKD